MREIGDMVDGNVTQGPLRLSLSAFPAGTTRISNRKSGIRIHVKAPEISTIQISNRNIRRFCVHRGESRSLIAASAAHTIF